MAALVLAAAEPESALLRMLEMEKLVKAAADDVLSSSSGLLADGRLLLSPADCTTSGRESIFGPRKSCELAARDTLVGESGESTIWRQQHRHSCMCHPCCVRERETTASRVAAGRHPDSAERAHPPPLRLHAPPHIGDTTDTQKQPNRYKC